MSSTPEDTEDSQPVSATPPTVDDDDDPRAIPTADLIAEVRAAAEALGRAPTRDEMQEFGDYSPSTYEKRFGSWIDGLEAAGVYVSERRRKRHQRSRASRGSDDE